MRLKSSVIWEKSTMIRSDFTPMSFCIIDAFDSTFRSENTDACRFRFPKLSQLLHHQQSQPASLGNVGCVLIFTLYIVNMTYLVQFHTARKISLILHGAIFIADIKSKTKNLSYTHTHTQYNLHSMFASMNLSRKEAWRVKSLSNVPASPPFSVPKTVRLVRVIFFTWN